jgi:hypothetical protein
MEKDGILRVFEIWGRAMGVRVRGWVWVGLNLGSEGKGFFLRFDGGLS